MAFLLNSTYNNPHKSFGALGENFSGTEEKFYENPAFQRMTNSLSKIFSSVFLGQTISPAMISSVLSAMTAGQTDFTTPYAGYAQMAVTIIPTLLFGFSIPILGTVIGGFIEGIWGDTSKMREKIQQQLAPLMKVGKERRDEILVYLNATLPNDSEMVENWVEEHQLVDERILLPLAEHSEIIEYVFTPGETHIYYQIISGKFNPAFTIPTAIAIDKLYLYQMPYNKLTDSEDYNFQGYKESVRDGFIHHFNLRQEGGGPPSEYGRWHPKQLEREVLSEMGLSEVEGEKMWAARLVPSVEGIEMWWGDLPPQYYWDDSTSINPLNLELIKIYQASQVNAIRTDSIMIPEKEKEEYKIAIIAQEIADAFKEDYPHLKAGLFAGIPTWAIIAIGGLFLMGFLKGKKR